MEIPRSLLIDTWGWCALASQQETRHHEVLDYVRQCRKGGTRIVTTDYILDETFTLIFKRNEPHSAAQYCESILESLRKKLLLLEPIYKERFNAAWLLRMRFKDKPSISFTDLTTMVVMQETGISKILSDDRHFLHVGLVFELVP